MSYFPAKYPNEITPALKKFAAFEGRIDLTKKSGSTTTTASFIMPALNAEVQITVSSTSGFVVGDKVSIGELYGYYTTAASPTPLTNPLTLTPVRLGSWRANYLLGLGGLYVKSQSGVSTTTTSSFTVPAILTHATASVSVAAPASLPNSGLVKVTSYAGVYEVTKINGASLLTVQLVHLGDLAPGDTVQSGVWCSAGTLLGITPASWTSQFYSMNVLSQVTRTGGSGSNTPAIAVGWGANADSGAATCAYNQFVDGETSGGGTLNILNSAVVNAYRFHSMNSSPGSSSNAANRIGVPSNMPIFALVNTASNGNLYEIVVCVRGFFSA